MVRSGGGIHLYIPIETVDITGEEKLNQWRNVTGDLAFLLHKYGSDIKCIDTCRILRSPFTRNRKEKYGKDGLEVSVMRTTEKRFTLEEVGEKITWLIRGGDKQYFESILEDIFYYEEEETEVSEEDDIMSNFFPIDFDDDIFPDEPQVYVPSKVILEELKRLERLEREAKEKEIEQTKNEAPLERPVHFGEVSENVKNSYQGICVDYNSLPDIMWQSRDLLFYLCNRATSEGCRNNILFFFCFNAYYFEGKRKLDELINMCKWINEKYFKPPLPEEELSYTVKHWYNIFKMNIRTKYVRNETIQTYFPFTDKEKEYTTGNYYPVDSNEYLEKKRKSHAKNSLEQHHRKREAKGIESLKSKQERTKQFIREHPEAPYSKAKEDLGIGESFFYRQRKSIQEELGLRKEKPAYESLFMESPDITYEEFKEKFDVTKCTFYRQRRKYLNK